MRQINRFGIMLGVLLSVVLVMDGVGAPPPIVNYQGRVSVDGVHFDGTGQFKFALVDGGTDLAAPATAEATVTGGFITEIDVLDGGAGYVDPPAVTIEDATGTGAEATATVVDGEVTAITVNNAGSGYSPDPTVTLDPPPADIAYATYWSHDGSSLDGSEPDTAIGIPVQHGLYAVPLGDVTVEGMSEALSADVFAGSDVRLRVWFDDGEHGFRQLAPDQRVTSVGYALMAADVAAGVWRLGGNADTVPGTHFLGTTDEQALELRANNQRALRIEPYEWDAESPLIVAGHAANEVSGAGATVSGGGRSTAPNRAMDYYATVSGGSGNTADGSHATVGGGGNNFAGASWGATVGGGSVNTASGECATVGGGYYNWAVGTSAMIPGGESNFATNYAFAAGLRAKANHQGAFVWGDSTDENIVSTTANEVVFRCNGGVRFTSGFAGGNQTVSWAPGEASWSFSSDRELKENFDSVDPQTVLNKVATLPISEWNYKGYEQRHIGPMAQDFYAAFPLAGASPTSINSLHLDGVALAAIQGLNQKVEELRAENERLASELEAIKQYLGL